MAVKTEPKLEPTEAQYSLADLDGITDLLPIQTGQLSPLSPPLALRPTNWLQSILIFQILKWMQSHLMTWISGTKAVREQRIGTLWPADLDTWRLAGNNNTGLSITTVSHHSQFPKNPAVWRFITSIYLPHSQMEPDDISSVQNREVGERQRGELQQLTFWFQLQRWRGLQSDWTAWECHCCWVHHSLMVKYFNTGCWKYFNKFSQVISVFNTCKACLNSKFLYS